ncbi:MAG TPA: hypothetical protein VIJ14_07015 [Rhabdochlamydiaceae bacterium]
MAKFYGLSDWEREIKWWMLEEYINGTVQMMKDRILEFKETLDPKLFSLLLFRYDRFAIYICAKFKRKYTFLANVNLQDLYPIAIIATYKAFVSMPVTWEAEKILMRIRSYIRQELFTKFDDKVALQSVRLEDYEWDLGETKSVQALENRINCLIILDSLPAEDRDLLIKKVMENRSFEDLRKDYGNISKQALSARLNKILKKIRRVIDKE